MDITTPIAVEKLEVWLSRRDQSAQAMGGFGLDRKARRLKQITNDQRGNRLMGHTNHHAARLEAGSIAGRTAPTFRGHEVIWSDHTSPKRSMGVPLSSSWGVAHRTSLVRFTLRPRDGLADIERLDFWGEGMEREHGARVVMLDAWRLRRNHVRGALDVDEFGPDAVPIAGAEIPAADLASRSDFDGGGVFRGGLPVGIAMPPLANLDVALHADGLAKLGDGHCPVCGEVFVESHADMVAVATDFASSRCSRSDRYRDDMNSAAVQQYRRDRLAKAAEKAGGKAALGRLLGYQDGAFVGQMLRGERPIKEDTVLKLEAKPGFKGWFEEPSATPANTGELSPLEEDLLAAFRAIPEDEQQELVQHTMAQAERYNKLVQQLLEKRGLALSGFASATKAAENLPPAPAAPAPAKKPKLIKSGDMDAKRVPSPMSAKAKQRRVG